MNIPDIYYTDKYRVDQNVIYRLRNIGYHRLLYTRVFIYIYIEVFMILLY